MSASQTLALCIDCWEFNYGVSDSNGVFTRDSPAPNCWDHAVHVFGPPSDYPPPISGVLSSVAAGVPISDQRMEMFSLACAIGAIQPNNGREVAPPTDRERELLRGVVTEGGTSWEPRTSTRRAEPVDAPQGQPDLFGGAA